MTHIRRDVRIPADGVELEASFESPHDPLGVVIFAHGSGSSRMSARNRFVAIELRRAGFATLLLDLLTESEDLIYDRRFDIGLLSERLQSAVRWANLPIGLFGASTGAAAALEVAGTLGPHIGAVVSRGGRPDLATPAALSRVTAATLLIVGGQDATVLSLNEQAYEQLDCEKNLTIVPGATHLFVEPGTLEAVAGLAAEWFGRHLHEQALPRHRPGREGASLTGD